MADWSMLPCDVLGQIALKLNQPDDFIYFSAVCHSWNHASSLVKSFRNPNSVMPWLFLAENTNENPECFRKVYNLSHKKFYRLKVPETFGKRCWGSSYGWIAMQTFDYQVHLFNPITKACITSLPSLRTLSYSYRKRPPEGGDFYEGWDPVEVQQIDFYRFVSKIVVLKMPCNQPRDDDGDWLVALRFGEFQYLAFARPGDQSWTYIQLEKCVLDVTCCGDRIYILCVRGELRCCDVKGCGDLNDLRLMKYAPSGISKVLGDYKFFLLVLGGDLVMVIRDMSTYDNHTYLNVRFDVYKLDDKIDKWVKIEDIGNYSIFVGYNSSMAIPTSVANNCIYFADDRDVSEFPEIGGYDMGVYDIGSRDLKQIYQGDARSRASKYTEFPYLEDYDTGFDYTRPFLGPSMFFSPMC